MIRFLVGLVAVAGMATIVSTLDLESVKEGSCLPYKPASNINMTWATTASLPYLSGGNKYQLFRIASNHPQFSQIRDHEFYYQACFQPYANITTGVGLVYGFGGIIGNYDVRVSPEDKRIIDFIPLPTPGMDDISRHTITLTDNKSFIFFANCWTGSNQRGWNIVSTKPTLDMKTQKLIEDHAESLGFFRDQMVFLRYESCNTNSPVPGSKSNNPLERSAGGRTSQAKLMEQRFNKRGRRHA